MKRRVPKAFVYVIGTHGKGGVKTYVGWTLDLDKRLAAHNDGRGAKFTRGNAWRLLYAEGFKSTKSAMSREWYVKRNRTLRALLRKQF